MQFCFVYIFLTSHLGFILLPFSSPFYISKPYLFGGGGGEERAGRREPKKKKKDKNWGKKKKHIIESLMAENY